MKKAALYLCSTLLFLGLLPLILAFAGIGLAGLLGCDLSGAQLQTCLVMGADFGPALTTMMMMHWLGIVGLPIAAFGALGLAITGAVHIFTRPRRP